MSIFELLFKIISLLFINCNEIKLFVNKFVVCFIWNLLIIYIVLFYIIIQYVVYFVCKYYNLSIKSESVICKLVLVTLPSRYWFNSSIVLSISVLILVCIVIILYYYPDRSVFCLQTGIKR